MWDWVKEKAGSADQRIAEDAARRAYEAKLVGVGRNVGMINRAGDNEGYRKEVLDRIGRTAGAAEAERAGIEALLQTPEGRARVSKEHARFMPRGIGGFGSQGPMEAINRAIATNAIVRRGALPTAIGGGVVLGGAGLTAGAQQLMALMEYMNAGRQTAEDAQQPLTS